MRGTGKVTLLLLVLLMLPAAVFLLTGGADGVQANRGLTAKEALISVGNGGKRDNPKIQSSVGEISARFHSQGADAAKGFADEREIKVADGKVVVVLESASTAGEVVAALAAVGGEMQTAHGDLIQASVPLEGIEALAASPSIKYVREPQRPAAFTTSEGAADIGAPAWQAAGQSGAGVKIAVLDPGFAGYDQLVASGELPDNVITASFRSDGDITGGGEDHGAACAEIIYDIASGAQLYLVNFGTDVELGNAVDYLIAEGVDVVSASWGFFGSFRGDGQGTINDMVQQAQQAGILWANAAGNAAQSHWSGAWADGDGDSWNEFTAGDETNSFNIASGSRVDIFLSWNKWPATDQDYDIYLVWEGQPDKAIAASDSWQAGGQPPAEEIHYTVPSGKGGNYWVVIKKYSANGNASFKLYVLSSALEHQVAAGSLSGQPTDSPYAMTVGAVAANTTTLESFSSQGPTVDGRTKPDIVAPDRVTTATYGSIGFWGTSAAAPHAAGAAALARGIYPTYTPASLQEFLESRATDLGAAGKDNLYGSGKLDLGAVPSVCEKPQLSFDAATPLWASYADYQKRELSVTMTLCNTGSYDALDVALVGSINTNSVFLATSTPVGIGDIASGNCVPVSIKYSVPVGVQSFISTAYVNASNVCSGLYNYPGLYPGP